MGTYKGGGGRWGRMRERGFCFVWNCMIFLMLQFELELDYFSNFINIGPSFLANQLIFFSIEM
jgi:hypothetical protein